MHICSQRQAESILVPKCVISDLNVTVSAGVYSRRKADMSSCYATAKGPTWEGIMVNNMQNTVTHQSAAHPHQGARSG